MKWTGEISSFLMHMCSAPVKMKWTGHVQELSYRNLKPFAAKSGSFTRSSLNDIWAVFTNIIVSFRALKLSQWDKSCCCLHYSVTKSLLRRYWEKKRLAGPSAFLFHWHTTLVKRMGKDINEFKGYNYHSYMHQKIQLLFCSSLFNHCSNSAV